MLRIDAMATFNHLRLATPLMVLDHGRAGNAFFSCLFDQHPEVLVVPHVGHLLFKLTRKYGDRRRISGGEAVEFLMSGTDFHYVASDMSEDIAREYVRLGHDPTFPIDRALTRETLKSLLEPNGSYSKADVVAAMYGAYAVGTGREVSRVKYLLMHDSPLHFHRHLKSTLSNACELLGAEFDDLVIIHLVRDPRAAFASLRQQFIRERNGMYPFTLRGLGAAIKGIFLGSAAWCVFTNILEYTTAGARELYGWRGRSPKNFFVVRNEDLNLQFVPTMKKITDSLKIQWFDGWSRADYAPTSGGLVWKGSGAYNTTYQGLSEQQAGAFAKIRRATVYRFSVDKFLSSDAEATSRAITGPNRYVTERWRSKLTPREIRLLEAVYHDELVKHGYETIYDAGNRMSRLRGLLAGLLPFSGELLGSSWMETQLRSGFFSCSGLVKDLVLFPVLFVCSRLAFLRLYFTGRLQTH